MRFKTIVAAAKAHCGRAPRAPLSTYGSMRWPVFETDADVEPTAPDISFADRPKAS